MKYQDVLRRINGIGCAVFSLSWEPPKSQIVIAKKVVTFLEDRRVLYNPNELEVPEHCKESVLQIREFITQLLSDVDAKSELGIVLRTMRAACRRFLDLTSFTPLYRYEMGMGDQFSFDTGLGELRGAIGLQLAKLLVMYGIDCEGDLLTILPPELE